MEAAMAVRGRLREARRCERGYSLVELVVVIAILSVVVGTLSTIFVTASHGEQDMSRRVEAQAQARMALDKLRREVRCASSVSPAGPASSITLTMPAQCPTAHGATTVRWCVLLPPGGTSGHYSLYRSTGASCSTSGVDWADNLRWTSIFNYSVQSSQSLGSLAISLQTNTKSTTQGAYNLSDAISLRNSTRTCIVGSPSPPC
jgi:prepilin-type N-terminal cleavage/methylation domain-containing protein